MGSPRVLVIPGLGGHAALLTGVGSALFPGLRVVPFEHDQLFAEGGVEGLAEQALGRLDADHGGESPAYVCGESFGGTVALTLARRYPERVRGLLLFNAFGRYPAPGCRGAEVGLTVWRLLGDRIAGQLIRVSRPLGVPGTLGFRFSRKVLWSYLRHPQGPSAQYHSKCEAAVRFDARPWLGSVTRPTFILTGTWDPIVPTAASFELARLMPDARLHQLPGGHGVYFVRASEAGQLVSRWMTGVVERPPPTVAGLSRA